METGLIGFPLSGKTTIFNAITGSSAATAAFGSGGGKLNLAEVKVPDERLAKLAAVFKPKKVTNATVLVKDITLEIDAAGRLAASALPPLRNLDALVFVLRAFENPAVPPRAPKASPLFDFKHLMDCLIFADFEVCERRLERLQKEGKSGSREAQLLAGFSKKLSAGEIIGPHAIDKQDARLLAGFCFLTAKPLIALSSTGEKSFPTADLAVEAQKLAIPYMEIRGDLEMEIAQLPAAEQSAFLADIGASEPAVNRFLREIYKSLNLISFLTAGEDEVRAWSITNGTPAQAAAGKIHTDLEKGFIRAEVIPWQDLVEAGGFAEARKHGTLRLEGKEYVVKDGDVLTIRFNL